MATFRISVLLLIKSSTFWKYRSPSYLIIYRSHTLLKMVRFFGPPCICIRCTTAPGRQLWRANEQVVRVASICRIYTYIMSISIYRTVWYRPPHWRFFLCRHVHFTALHGMQAQSSDEHSVRLSVCLSVKRVNCDKTEERSVQIIIGPWCAPLCGLQTHPLADADPQIFWICGLGSDSAVVILPW